MPNILLINPNTSPVTTDMMVRLVQERLPAGWEVTGCTAASGVPMIVNEQEMAHAAVQVGHSWQRHARDRHWSAVIVSAFGDPGIAFVRGQTRLPVAGICEASLHAAAQGGRRFGIATVTPGLERLIAERVRDQGLEHAYTGIRFTEGDPCALAADPARLRHALEGAVRDCVQQDGAQAVVIGGGPLGQAAAELQRSAGVAVIAPLAAVAAQLRLQLLGITP
ncbi:MAG: aspartate/glutamate racemase family protein [Comamonadaceae bacterium]|nr:MAG: aspartate/glutamate racemase family protein [Comamonadaceae bacterium]